MADESPIGSPLSILSSDAFDGDEDHDQMGPESLMPPAKRQKMADSLRATPTSHQLDWDNMSLSSDSSGDVPNSPSNLRPEDDDIHEQVTICAWVGCDAGDMGNMDNLVEHIHNEHIETRAKKYTCEWSDCIRRSMPHASGYALKAHMRSHTREKPFYCALPECDRAFTRSDALAKHMRTVHETEALRPSDPVPVSMRPTAKASRLKLVVKQPQAPAGQASGASVAGEPNGVDPSLLATTYPSELGITAEEELKGPLELYRLLRRQVQWAEEEADSLKTQVEFMEELRKKEWKEKEILLDQVLNAEVDYFDRKQKVLAGLAIPTADEIRAAAARLPSNGQGLDGASDILPSSQGQPIEDQRDAAAILASLHQA